jgi:hypothetical protein
MGDLHPHLRLMPDEPYKDRSSEWWVLAVHTCEKSNLLLVLRQVILASRNLPILFYRVHTDQERAYGTGWMKKLPSNNDG